MATHGGARPGAGRPAVGSAINIRIGDQRLERVDAWAAARNTTRAAAIRQFIDDGLDATEDAMELVTDTDAIHYDDPAGYPDGYTVGYVVPAGTTGDLRMVADDTLHIPVNTDEAGWEQGLREVIADSERWAITGQVAKPPSGSVTRVCVELTDAGRAEFGS